MKDIPNASYGVLSTLRKLKHFTELHPRKRLAESLVLSRLDYCDSVYSPLPGYFLKSPQNNKFEAASFVYGRCLNDIGSPIRCGFRVAPKAFRYSVSYGRYVNDIGDILNLKWLPLEERKDFNLLKLTFEALHTKQWPPYLNLQRVSIWRNLRSSDSIRLQIPLEKGTFPDTAAALLPSWNLKKV